MKSFGKMVPAATAETAALDVRVTTNSADHRPLPAPLRRRTENEHTLSRTGKYGGQRVAGNPDEMTMTSKSSRCSDRTLESPGAINNTATGSHWPQTRCRMWYREPTAIAAILHLVAVDETSK